MASTSGVDGIALLGVPSITPIEPPSPSLLLSARGVEGTRERFAAAVVAVVVVLRVGVEGGTVPMLREGVGGALMVPLFFCRFCVKRICTLSYTLRWNFGALRWTDGVRRI